MATNQKIGLCDYLRTERYAFDWIIAVQLYYSMGGCYWGHLNGHSHTKIAPLPSKITYIQMDPRRCIRNGFGNPSPYNLYIYSHTLNLAST